MDCANDLYIWALHSSPVAFSAWFPPDSANLLTHHILFGNNPNINGSLLDNPYADLMDGYKSFSGIQDVRPVRIEPKIRLSNERVGI